MAHTTTARWIVMLAYAHSKKNNPGQVATDSPELVALVQRALEGLWVVASRINPTYFAESAELDLVAAGGWARPEGAESVFRLERFYDSGSGSLDTREACVLVPFNDQDAEIGSPRLYKWGQMYFSVGQAGDPGAADTIIAYYSRRPAPPTNGDGVLSMDALLDPLWEEEFNELLALEVAIYLAIKDGRPEEIQGLVSQRDSWLRRFIAFLQHETVGDHATRFAPTTWLDAPATPVAALLAGGSNVEV